MDIRRTNEHGKETASWIDTDNVIAFPYDILIPNCIQINSIVIARSGATKQSLFTLAVRLLRGACAERMRSARNDIYISPIFECNLVSIINR